jgi:GntR family transcriptional repressor for pyruvate dehydrogenase complex
MKAATRLQTRPPARSKGRETTSGRTRAARPNNAGQWIPVRPVPLSRRITDQVRRALFEGHIGPGDFLGTEASLAREFGVSRMVSRDALRSLEAIGIVEIRQGAGGGARVASESLDRFVDALGVQLRLIGVTEGEALEAQLALESSAAELAAKRATPADIQRLREIVDESARQVSAPRRFTELGTDFHLAVAEAAHNRALLAQLRALHQVLQPAFGRRTNHERAVRVVAAHRDLVSRIVAGDAAGARSAMCCHLEGVRQRGFETRRAPRARNTVATALEPRTQKAVPCHDVRTRENPS